MNTERPDILIPLICLFFVKYNKLSTVEKIVYIFRLNKIDMKFTNKKIFQLKNFRT